MAEEHWISFELGSCDDVSIGVNPGGWRFWGVRSPGLHEILLYPIMH